MTEVGQLVAWSTFVALIVVARLLVSAPALRVLGPRLRRLGEWAVARMDRPEEVDPEVEEMAIYLRRQRLNAHLDRVRRLMLDDEWMSATRQLGNRLAYASLVREIATVPEVYAVPAPVVAAGLSAYAPRRVSSPVEILEVGGWR